MTNKVRQFIRGMGSAIDLGGSAMHSQRSVGAGLGLDRTDAQALRGDWQKLSQDFGSAFSKTVGKDGGHVQSE